METVTTVTVSEVLLFHFLYSVVGCAGGQGYEGEGRVLVTGGGHARAVLRGLFGLGIYYEDAFCFIGFFVIEDLRYDAVWLQCEVAGALRPGYRRGVGVEVAAEGAASFAHVAGLALSAALLQVDGLGLGEMGAAAEYWVVVEDGVGEAAAMGEFPGGFGSGSYGSRLCCYGR